MVGSILFMGAMQKYFTFVCELACGIPTITLLGEKADYEKILKKMDKLEEYGDEPAQFGRLLKPVLRRFIYSFDHPTSQDTIDFWQQIFSIHRNFSGPTVYSGWITAFCFWKEDGKCLYDRRRESKTQLYGVEYHKVSYSNRPTFRAPNANPEQLNSKDIPNGWSKVPVTVDDNGQEIKTEMIAGSIGINCSRSGKPLENGELGLDTMQPQTGWWMFAEAE